MIGMRKFKSCHNFMWDYSDNKKKSNWSATNEFVGDLSSTNVNVRLMGFKEEF